MECKRCGAPQALPFTVCAPCRHEAEGTRDLFVETCERLRSMGALSVSAFGMSATFEPVKPVAVERERKEPEQEMPSGLTADEQDLWRRARGLLGGKR